MPEHGATGTVSGTVFSGPPEGRHRSCSATRGPGHLPGAGLQWRDFLPARRHNQSDRCPADSTAFWAARLPLLRGTVLSGWECLRRVTHVRHFVDHFRPRPTPVDARAYRTIHYARPERPEPARLSPFGRCRTARQRNVPDGRHETSPRGRFFVALRLRRQEFRVYSAAACLAFTRVGEARPSTACPSWWSICLKSGVFDFPPDGHNVGGDRLGS